MTKKRGKKAARIRFDDNEDLIDICMDNVFKAVFTKDIPASQTALSRLVSAIIDRDVQINEILEREEGIAMASEVLLSISRDEAERARLMSEYKYQLDMQSKLVHAKREGENRIIELWKSGKPLEEVIKEYGGD